MNTLSQNNCFTPRLCAIKGILKTEPILKATPKDTQLHAKTAVQREKLVLSDNYNQISITTPEASDRSKRVAGRHIRG
jgi:hypothetical protein